jgi:hypothetical protein
MTRSCSFFHEKLNDCCAGTYCFYQDNIGVTCPIKKEFVEKTGHLVGSQPQIKEPSCSNQGRVWRNNTYKYGNKNK